MFPEELRGILGILVGDQAVQDLCVLHDRVVDLGLCLACGDHYPRVVVEQAVHHFSQIIVSAPVDEIEVHLCIQLLGLQEIRLRLLESPAEFDQFLNIQVRDRHAQGDRLHLEPGLEDLQDFVDGDVRDIDAFFRQDL